MAFTVARLTVELSITEDQAKQIIRLIRREISPYTVPAVDTWRSKCYHEPREYSPEVVIKAIDAVIGTCGTEAIFSDRHSMYQPVMEYCNTGETYDPTIVYDYPRERWLISSWGDWVEKYGRRYGLDRE